MATKKTAAARTQKSLVSEAAGPVLYSMGRSGLKQNGGYLDDEWHPKLKGQLAAKMWREIGDNNPIVGGILWLMESILQSRDLRAEPPEGYEDSAEAKNLADWYNGALDDMESTFPQILSELATTPQFGHCELEVLMKLRKGPDQEQEIFRSKFSDGLFGWRDWAIRAQESILRWEIEPHTGKVKGFWQQIVGSGGGMFFVPIEKCLHFKMRSRKKSPEPPGMLRHVYRPYYFLKRNEELEGVGVQRQCAGFLAIFLPWQAMHPNASAAERTMRSDAEDTVQKASVDALTGLVLPSAEDRQGKTGFDARFMAPEGDLSVVDPINRRYREEIAIAMLSQVLLFGGGDTGGTRSLGEVSVGMLGMTLDGLLRTYAGVIDNTAIPDLGQLNQFPREILPCCHYKRVELPDVTAFASAVSQLLTSGGLVSDDSIDERARDLLSIKPRRGPSATQLPLPMPGAPAAQPTAQPAKGRRRTR